jgi:hypothetical protein
MSDLTVGIETFIRNGVPSRICTLIDEILCGEIALHGMG